MHLLNRWRTLRRPAAPFGNPNFFCTSLCIGCLCCCKIWACSNVCHFLTLSGSLWTLLFSTLSSVQFVNIITIVSMRNITIISRQNNQHHCDHHNLHPKVIIHTDESRWTRPNTRPWYLRIEVDCPSRTNFLHLFGSAIKLQLCNLATSLVLGFSHLCCSPPFNILQGNWKMMSSHNNCLCSPGDAHYVDQQLRSETQISFALHCVLDVFVVAKSEQLRTRDGRLARLQTNGVTLLRCEIEWPFFRF